MGFRPRGLLLFTSLLLIWEGVRGEPSFVIDTVGLTILPKNNVQSGSTVTIRCQASVSFSNISQIHHLFEVFRNDVQIHTANTTKDSVDHVIDPARVADTGRYYCQVSVKNKHKLSTDRILDITGLQTPILHVNNSTPYESEEFKVTCSAPEEKGGLAFNFYQTFRAGQPEWIKQLRSTNNFLETTLTLRHIGDCILSCDYEINVVTASRRSNSSDGVQMKVKALDITPDMTIIPNDIYEPDVVEVICNTRSPLENIEIFLIKDRTVLKKVSGKALSHRFESKAAHSGELVCKAEWRNVQRDNYKTLTVKEVFSEPQLTLEPGDLFEGDTFTLKCLVNFFVPGMIDPSTFRYIFYKDGTRLTSTAKYVTVAHPEHNGNYSCKAEGTRHSSLLSKESQTILVKAKVPVSDPVLSVDGGKMFLGKPFRLICHSHNGTFPIKYTIFGPNGLTLHREVSRSEEQAIFDIPLISKTSDLNKFICHARNNPRSPPKIALGQQLLTSTIIIEPVSKPKLTVLPSVDITEGQNINLVCSVQTGSRPINFTWYNQESPGALVSMSSNKLKESHIIQNANGKHIGKYFCTSTNPANEIKSSDVVTIGVTIAGWKKALIIVFCILLLLTLALVIALKTRLLRLKRKTTGNLSVKSVSTKTERLSLTQEEFDVANATPSMMGKSVWSDHVSGSESDDQNSNILPEKPEPQYTEVQKRDAHPAKDAEKQGTDTVDSEVRNSQQGVPEVADGKPVEYAQLNHDSDQQPDNSQASDQSPSNENRTETGNKTDVQAGGTCDPAPDC
ncbi:platelet endothelial cell adhesion molecule [Fundulus diaphanus]